MPVFASNWCLRTRSARVSASWMSISSNKSSHIRSSKAFAPSKGCGSIWGGLSTRESAVHAMQAGAKEWAAFGQCVPCNSSIHWQASASQERGELAPATTSLGWTFRLGTRWASGQLEGARRRAGTHPRLRQQGPEPARRTGGTDWGSHEFREILFEIRECLRFSVDFCFPHPKFKFWGGKSTVRDRNGQGPEKKLRRRPPEWPFSQEIEHFHQTNEKHD